MKFTVIVGIMIIQIVSAHALVISEVMSNPVGDDSGREWIEVYNNSDVDVDLSQVSISIKGGNFAAVNPVSGGNTLTAHGYAIIGSTVSGTTRFMSDYPTFSKPLAKSAISLVNTGVTSVELKLGGVTADTIASYTAAKEGTTYSLLNGSFSVGLPTPGEENQIVPVEQPEATTTPTSSQTGIAKMSSPSADIVFYLPSEKTVVAGAPSVFSVSSLTHAGKAIDGMNYVWSFGDGGERTGSSTIYRYFYPGRYIAQVEGANGFIAGMGRMNVRVVSPDLQMSSIKIGKYGSYIDIGNQNIYDIDISGWKLVIDNVPYSFPKNTIIQSGGETHVSGQAMGFASTTVSSTTIIKLLFPSMDEVMRVYQVSNKDGELIQKPTSTIRLMPAIVSSDIGTITKNKTPYKVTALKAVEKVATTSSSNIASVKSKDTRIASWFKGLLVK